jgi:Tol biopolymer transport system component
MRTDENLHAHIEIENLRTGETRRLLDANAFLPRWSPNGKYISCAVWKSPGESGELTVVDVDSGTVIVDPEIRASGRTSKWSPDSRTVAAAGVMYGRPRALLYTVTVPDGATTAIDTLNVLSDYGFSWSPNGRWLAFSRPSALDPIGEDPIASDIWIADAETGQKWPLVVTSGWVESNPLWITNETLQIDRASVEDGNVGVEHRVVVELSRGEDHRRPPK